MNIKNAEEVKSTLKTVAHCSVDESIKEDIDREYDEEECKATFKKLKDINQDK